MADAENPPNRAAYLQHNTPAGKTQEEETAWIILNGP